MQFTYEIHLYSFVSIPSTLIRYFFRNDSRWMAGHILFTGCFSNHASKFCFASFQVLVWWPSRPKHMLAILYPISDNFSHSCFSLISSFCYVLWGSQEVSCWQHQQQCWVTLVLSGSLKLKLPNFLTGRNKRSWSG